jgi:DNA-binding Lrp family transcriptional regulator
MDVAAGERPTRLPRFRRASEPPAFRLTDDDVEIIRQVARHRLIRSTHIAALVGRSLHSTNDRLLRLFHAGYIDRPRAQLDYYPTGSAPMVYALADRGARLLRERDGISIANPEVSRKNREAGRPFIEHQVEIVNFQVALQRAVAQRSDVRLIPVEDMNAAASRRPMPASRAPFALRAKLAHRGAVREVSVVPDIVFGLRSADGSRRNFMVEIDRGTMPIARSRFEQTSFEKKMRAYLTAHAAKQHERQFGWKNFRVLAVTTDRERMQSMKEVLRGLRAPRSIGAALFLFSTFDDLRAGDPLSHAWTDGIGRRARLMSE